MTLDYLQALVTEVDIGGQYPGARGGPVAGIRA